MMKYLWLPLLISALFACEDQIDPTLPDADPVLSVDAWINDKPEPQVIRLTTTQPYFDNTPPPVVLGATVEVSSPQGERYVFSEDERNPGTYVWTPPSESETLGTVGYTYQLRIESAEGNYTAETGMSRTTPIDSITFEFLGASAFNPETYLAQLWATDSAGAGDAYWIKVDKNGESINGAGEIRLVYDGGFSRGGAADGAVFISPVRTSINSFDQDDNDAFLPAYLPGDSIHVELHSLSDAAFDYWNQVQIQVNRPGGFGELFANPLANVPTNIRNTDPDGPAAVGFFNVAAVSGLGKRLD